MNVITMYNPFFYLFFVLPSPNQIVYTKSRDLLYCIFCAEHDLVQCTRLSTQLYVMFCKYIKLSQYR